MTSGKIILIVSVLLFNDKDQLLLLKRSLTSKTNKNLWQLPEGKMEYGEEPIQTVERELMEETSLTLKNPAFFTIKTSQMFFEDTNYHLVRLVYKGDFTGTIKLDTEHSSFKWLSLDQIKQKKDLIPGLIEIVKELN
jgi:8-oxo-dGTP diphosphatase